jgi:uncharacterized repeat protein (TIGR04138 family)
MTTPETHDTDWNAVLRTAGPYPIEAFQFVRDGLNHTVEKVVASRHAAAQSMSDVDPASMQNPAPGGAGGPGLPADFSSELSGPSSQDLGGPMDPTQGMDPLHPSHPSHPPHPMDPMGSYGPAGSNHVTGQQLCMGLRDYAIERYGMLAPAVLKTWNVRRTDDFGRIVFAMIEHGLMSKTPDDSIEDFRGVFDFEEAFARDALLRHIRRS